MGSTAELLADGDRSLRELLDSAETFPIDVAVAISLRAIHAVHVAHGQYAPRYGRLSLGAVALDFAGSVRVDWQSDSDDAFVVHDTKLDRRSDVLVLGLMLQCLATTGRDDHDLPAGLASIIAKATASQPMDRYQTAIAMHGALDRFAQASQLPTHDAVIGDYVLEQLGVPEAPAPIPTPVPAALPLAMLPVPIPIPAPPARAASSSGVPVEIIDPTRAVTARIPIPALKTGRIPTLPSLPVIAPIEPRVRPRTVQIPARGTAPNPLLDAADIDVALADGTRDNPCDDGWEMPETADAPALPPAPMMAGALVIPRPASEPGEVYELEDSDLEVPEVWPD